MQLAHLEHPARVTDERLVDAELAVKEHPTMDPETTELRLTAPADGAELRVKVQ